MGLFKTLAWLVLLGGFIYCGATVPLGDHTFFGHVQQIWASDETQDLVDGVKEASDPMIDRIERGVQAGVRAARSDPDAGEQAAPDKTARPPVEKRAQAIPDEHPHQAAAPES
ncbi:MAG TPA: hypothetical protein VFG83_07310 [Kofleriaceae bacterium]|nr:hypothetical protein [Kofleriaceae bacterium]